MQKATETPPGRPARLQGWGRDRPKATWLLRPSHPDRVADYLTSGPLIARGAGRSYGDSAVSPGLTIDMRGCDRLLGYDPTTRQLTAEAGVLLSDLIRFALPKGAFPPVVPGTRAVTLGGMIAADVHGKNHHRAGSLRHHLAWIDLMGPDGRTERLSPTAPLFQRTVGGMGLTGVILRAALCLAPVETGYLRQTVTKAQNLHGLLSALRAAETHEHAVAWMDALAEGDGMGRGYVLGADHLRRPDLPPALEATPFGPPLRKPWAVPQWMPALPAPPCSAMRLLNRLHLQSATRSAEPTLLSWDRFFFPLDQLGGWNRLVGRKGFVQLHLLWPEPEAEAAIRDLLALLRDRALCPTLAVVKRMRAEPPTDTASISFATEGISLAMDLPRSAKLSAAVPAIMALSARTKGHFYLAKDSVLDRQTLRDTDPRAEGFAAWRKEAGLSARFESCQSERLGL